MNCVYYSRYPYEADDFKVVDAEKYGCKWRGSAYDMPFRLYKAAICEGNYTNAVYMVKDLFEALDMPQYKGVKNCMKPFKLKYSEKLIKVHPTKNYYGATNSMDGVYVIDEKYYIVRPDYKVKMYKTWRGAFMAIFKNNNYGFLKGFDLITN